MNKNEPLDLKKFPYLEQKKLSIESRKALVDLLNKRKMLIESDWDKLTDYDANERMILLNKTDVELAGVHKQIFDLQSHLDQRSMQIIDLLEEVEQKWDYVIGKAEKQRARDKDLDDYMRDADTSTFAENLEDKLSYYIRLRNSAKISKSALKTV